MQDLMDFKTAGVYKVLANLITDWNLLNKDAQEGYVMDALKHLNADGVYELANDITITGNAYFVEPYEVGLVRFGA